jgi:YfiH family protein
VSFGPFESLNLSRNVGDDAGAVQSNRRLLVDALRLPREPSWLSQVHGCEVVGLPVKQGCEADAAWSNEPGQVCAVMTADCLPVLLCNQAGTEVAAVHAGWRGLCDGVIDAAVERFSSRPEQLLAWLGPAIGPRAFEVGPEVRDAFLAWDETASEAFIRGRGDRWMADLFLLARQRLGRLGVKQVYGDNLCTYEDSQRFFSYRRDGVTGRMATMIWIETKENR